ncbi:hopanoid-associated sugar epimerase [Gloeobacter kilaueensis]|uniref:NAD-dependent epimerase/dehydratase n=1 Tax=Gloeobacter kilaueensis (strain ATCC BAA-2537 / CCAP 1431/1 / ULC 316 / JS1) TaxID=1183438 RepID=U5QHG5_GLOK1|nr:hopanoid-associated sugar epimerase [Gloeobacter kilaueensis]AGY58303.1 NAD-dependent epimerase/dehydratase [Gloeobacter kilaueensis JS1]
MDELAFVTGGNGFIGANLVRLLLRQGWRVRALVRDRTKARNLAGLDVDLVEGDLLTDDLAARMAGCRAVFHVAAHYSLFQADKEVLWRSNVLGTRSVLAAARRAQVERVVYTSSVAAIGVGGPLTDETYQSPPEKLIGAYKQSKYWAEQEAKRAVQSGQDVVIVNPAAPIGPWDSKPTPTGEIILRFLRRQMPFYLETGLNFIHVGDVAAGHLAAFERGRTGERYILGHRNLSLKQLFDELERITGIAAPQFTVPEWLPLGVAWFDEQLLAPLTGRPPAVAIDAVRMAAQTMYYDATKAVRELDLPQTPVRLALEDAVDWFLKNGYAGAAGG